MQRALSVLLVDLINVIVGGAVGMTILVFYHPYFLLYNALLLAGFNVVFFLMSHGGLKATIDISHAKYETLHWLQEIAYNLLHFKATDSQALLMQKDRPVRRHLRRDADRTRFGVLIRQYLGSVGWQAIAHSGLIATAGWLLGIGQLTLGQFVAAEVVVSGILLSFDGVVKRMGHIYYFLTALTELDFLFSLPKDQDSATLSVPLPDPTIHGIRVTCKDLAVSTPECRRSSNISIWKSRLVKKSASMPVRRQPKRLSRGSWRAWKRRPPASSATTESTFATSIFRPSIVVEGLCSIPSSHCSKARSKRTSCWDDPIFLTATSAGPSLHRAGRRSRCAAARTQNPRPSTRQNSCPDPHRAHPARASHSGPAANSHF